MLRLPRIAQRIGGPGFSLDCGAEVIAKTSNQEMGTEEKSQHEKERGKGHVPGEYIELGEGRWTPQARNQAGYRGALPQKSANTSTLGRLTQRLGIAGGEWEEALDGKCKIGNEGY